MGVEAHVHRNQRRVVGFNDLVEVEEVFVIGGIKKEHVALQHKARIEIMANARKMAIERKANGHKPFFVTCDSTKKPKPPPIKIFG